MSHKIDTNLKLISDNIHFRSTYVSIAAKRIDQFDIWQKIIYQEFNDIQIFKLLLSSTLTLFWQKLMLIWDLFY